MPTRSRSRRRTGHGDAIREEVLRVAEKAFASQGYRASSLARIAAAAGLSQPGLLHHFPTKQDLLVAVLARRDELDAERFGLSDLTGLALLDRLTRIVEVNAHLPELVQAFTLLTGESVGDDHPAQEWVRTRYARLRAEIAKNLHAGVKAGEIRADVDCEQVATEVLAMTDGLQLQWLLEPHAVDMVALFRGYIERLIAAIRA